MSEHLEIDEHIVQQLAETAAVMTAMLERMAETHEVQSSDLGHFRDDLVIVRNAISRVAKVLHEGNGDKPLITRVAVMEEKIAQLETAVEKLEEHNEEQEKSKKENRLAGLRGKYAVTTALISGIVALAIAVVSLFN